jgi:hypothetical protein
LEGDADGPDSDRDFGQASNKRASTALDSVGWNSLAAVSRVHIVAGGGSRGEARDPSRRNGSLFEIYLASGMTAKSRAADPAFCCENEEENGCCQKVCRLKVGLDLAGRPKY